MTGPDEPGLVVMEIPLAHIKPDPHNVRSGGVGNIDELTRSIKAQGVLQAVLVAEVIGRGGKVTYSLIAGHRRHAAASKAGLKTVPAMVRRGLDEQGRLEAQLTENLQRSNLTPIEEAAGYQRLVDLGVSQRQIATKMGCSQAHVSKRLQLLTLPAVDQKAIADGQLTVGAALALAPLVDHPAAYRNARQVADTPDRFRTVVAAEILELEQAPKREAARAEVEQLGYKVLEWPGRGSGWWNATFKPHAGTPPVDNLPDYYVSNIALEDCKHIAATIAPDGTVVTVCTNPKMHEPAKAKAKTSKPTAKEKAAAEEAKAARAAEEERQARLEQLGELAGVMRATAMAERLTPAHVLAAANVAVAQLDTMALALIEVLAAGVITSPEWSSAKGDLLEQLGGIEPVHGANSWDRDWPAGIYRWARANSATPAERIANVLAAAVVITTAEIHDYIGETDGHAGTALYRLLAAHGHQPSDTETQHLRVLNRLDETTATDANPVSA